MLGGPTTSESLGLPVGSRERRHVELADVSDVSSEEKAFSSERTGLKGDRGSIFLLVVLYLCQGAPQGVALASMPFLLRERGASYTSLAVFAVAGYPYSVKVLWSPVVDALYSKRFGRRKSWIVPVQLLCALILWHLSRAAPDLLAEGETGFRLLTIYFFVLVLMVATQDIAVDGWALTMLSEANVGWASTCQSIGLNSGYFISFTVFLALNSPDFSNAFLRPVDSPLPYGVLSLSSYLRFWSVAFLVVTLTVWAFKAERGPEGRSMPARVSDVYRCMWRICKLGLVRRLFAVLLLSRVAFSASDNVTVFKLMERGLRKDELALFALIQFPFEIGFVWAAGRWAQRASSPLSPVGRCSGVGVLWWCRQSSLDQPRNRPPQWFRCYRLRLVSAALGAVMVVGFPPNSEDGPGRVRLLILFVWSLCNSFLANVMFTSLGAFFARVADPGIGGTYLTLLNTVSPVHALACRLEQDLPRASPWEQSEVAAQVMNLGAMWPKPVVLWLVDVLTKATCDGGAQGGDEAGAPLSTSCVSMAAKEDCRAAGGTCLVSWDGYYVGILLCLGFGVLLTPWLRRQMEAMGTTRPVEWWWVALVAGAVCCLGAEEAWGPRPGVQVSSDKRKRREGQCVPGPPPGV